jgi:hypothetical protein
MSCQRDSFGRARCRDCNKGFNPFWAYINDVGAGPTHDDAYTVPQCEDCFESSLEDFEETRRERIAIKNEY